MNYGIQATFSGNATQAPQLHTFDDGGRKVAVTVAVNDKVFNPEESAWQERGVEYIKVQTRRNSLGRNILKSVRKGTPLVVRGQLFTSQWVTRDGRERTDLVLIPDSVAVSLAYGTAEYAKAMTAVVNEETGDTQPVDEFDRESLDRHHVPDGVDGDTGEMFDPQSDARGEDSDGLEGSGRMHVDHDAGALASRSFGRRSEAAVPAA